MEEALSFFRAFEVWIYLLLGLGGLIYIRKFILAWQELREAGFGLERESAQARLNQAASVLVFLLTVAVAEFVLVSFIAPTIPGAIPLSTPTLNVLATPTVTLAAETTLAAVQASPTPEPLMPGEDSGCVSGQVELSAPRNDQEVSSVVEVMGTADIPDFGFYKLEVKRPDETLWATIEAGNQIVQDGKLGNWDTRRLQPGVYELGLVVQNNQAISPSHCVVTVRVVPGTEETTQP